MNERLANEKISKLLLSLAIPSILAQMVTLKFFKDRKSTRQNTSHNRSYRMK